LKRSTIVILVILGVLVLDQWLKIYIKTNIHYGEGFDILGLEWAKIHFVENEGMAFGISFGGKIGKLLLSIFRILMVGLLFYLMAGLVKAKESKWLIFSFALIIAGALGNIIDSAVYGLIFSESKYHSGLATFMPEAGGYAGFLQGKVVDMLYFPLIDTYWPEWVPFVGGSHLQFFRPVFNIADSAISVGVISILLFHRSFFTGKDHKGAKMVAVPVLEPANDLAPKSSDQEE
jgi:signal peptidase II